VAGQSCKLLVVNHALLGAFASGEEIHAADVHSSITELACRLSRELGVGMLLLDVVTTDFGRPLAETGGAVVDCDLAPQLDILLADDAGMLDQAAEAFVRWMFPPGAATRIPVIAVTGTNGKTTTCHMIEHIQRAAGRHPGVVCSDGIFVDEKHTASRSDIGAGAHHGILEVDNVDVAVLEEYFGRILRVGFAFEWCDVSVCTNVTNDHLGRIGIHTLEEMANVKFEVVRRARGTAVLNAEDAFCLAMAQRAKAKRICLVSTIETAQKLSEIQEGVAGRCVSENEAGRLFIVIYDGAERIPLVAIDDIPATFAGVAAHNVSNAMHAAAACYFSGVPVPTIADALRSFRMSFESTPGRLNIFDGLPFRVIMDYAHNADGFRRICALVDRLPVSGKKLLMVGFSGDRQDVDIKAAATFLVGHFDHYVCRNFRGLRDRLPDEIPALLKHSLMSAGITDSAISIVPDADQAVQSTLARAKPGDLVVLLVGSSEFQRVWDLLRSMVDVRMPHPEEVA
jgi:cyanophycin synthetase